MEGYTLIVHAVLEKETYVDDDGEVTVKLTILEGPLKDQTFKKDIPYNQTNDIPEEEY